jgi:acyl carrier protein
VNRPEIVEAIGKCLAEVLKHQAADLSETTRLFDDLHLDSTSVLELLMVLEDNIGLEVDPESLNMDDFRTVGSLADYVDRNLADRD